MQQSYNLQTNNIFAPFSKFEQGQNTVKSTIIANIPNDTVEINSENKKNGVVNVYSSAFTIGIALMLALKGLHGTAVKELGNKIANINPTAALYARQGTDKTLNLLQASSNITTVRDVLFDRLCRKFGWSTKFADYSRQVCKNAVDKSLNKQYDKVGTKVNDMVTMVQNYSGANIKKLDGGQEVEIKGVSKTLSEWHKELIEEASNLQTHFNGNFGLGARQARSVHRDNELSGLCEKADEMLFKNGGWKKTDTYKSYITEELTRETQQGLREEIVNARKLITNNIDSICLNIEEKLSLLKYSRKIQDKETQKTVVELEQELKKYRLCSGIDEAANRKTSADKILQGLENTKKQINESTLYTKEEKESLLKTIKEITNEVEGVESSKGSLEKIMTILKGLNSTQAKEGGKIISDAEFKQFKGISKNITESLKEATDKEAGEYFLKQAEMAVGSAATDVFTVLGPIGLGAYVLSKCDDKEERISTGLKTCIPLVGSIGAFVYSTTKMLSGAKGLIFSFVSGFALNKFGTYLDNLYKNYQHSGSVAQVAKNESKSVMSDLTVGINGKVLSDKT